MPTSNPGLVLTTLCSTWLSCMHYDGLVWMWTFNWNIFFTSLQFTFLPKFGGYLILAIDSPFPSPQKINKHNRFIDSWPFIDSWSSKYSPFIHFLQKGGIWSLFPLFFLVLESDLLKVSLMLLLQVRSGTIVWYPPMQNLYLSKWTSSFKLGVIKFS